ncbi:hypothetical protein SK3146_02943 [Paenibacillus konkukensis]|uniref:Peptidase M56 BlaR1 n=1 Tax=Paenibacillus konkukensis TaxID=2020716 RepID=A0ABY4RMU1_9BACL|nr:hypothetical protein SK3146_02943 [Paenibacillus konkukensis]
MQQTNFRNEEVNIVRIKPMWIYCFIVITGIVIVTMANGSKPANNQIHTYAPDFPSHYSSHEYPTNENGQSYGSGLDAAFSDTEPDLIKAYGMDGTLGYVKSTDLRGDMPRTPEEAIALMDSDSERQIPLYDVHGKKVIGQFKVGASSENGK